MLDVSSLAVFGVAMLMNKGNDINLAGSTDATSRKRCYVYFCGMATNIAKTPHNVLFFKK